MEIDVVYLRALIQDCRDPVAVLQQANLPGPRDTEQLARNTLMGVFEKPCVYQRDVHGTQRKALQFLGVDVPEQEDVSVIAFKQLNQDSAQ